MVGGQADEASDRSLCCPISERWALLPTKFAHDNFLKSALEVFVEIAIDDGVEEGVRVAQPVDDCPQPLGHVAFTVMKGQDQDHNEE